MKETREQQTIKKESEGMEREGKGRAENKGKGGKERKGKVKKEHLEREGVKKRRD